MKSVISSLGLSAGYGLGSYAIFEGAFGGVLLLSFLTIVPLGIGYLGAKYAPEKYRGKLEYSVFIALVPFLLVSTVLVLLAAEIIVCITMAAPFYIGFAGVGAIIHQWVMKQRQRALQHRAMLEAEIKREEQMLLAGLLLLPLLLGFIESRYLVPHDSINTVESQVFIAADVDTVWQYMTTVAPISDAEWGWSAYRWFMLPQPIEAALDGEGVGAVRQARYENGLMLQEPITIWEPGERLSFDVVVDPASPRPFNMVGGKAFDVQEVAFWLEPVDDGTILHLSSRYRLTTSVNPYGELWVNWLLGDLQGQILEVIKVRAEKS